MSYYHLNISHKSVAFTVEFKPDVGIIQFKEKNIFNMR